MKHIAAYLLCVLGGNASPSADDVTAVITAAGGEADEAQLSLFFSEIEGKNVDELLAEGRTALASCAGAAGAAAPAAAASGAAAPAAAAAPAPKVEEVDALEGGMDMFGGGGSDY